MNTENKLIKKDGIFFLVDEKGALFSNELTDQLNAQTRIYQNTIEMENGALFHQDNVADYLQELNYNFSTQSNYPVSYLRIRETKITPKKQTKNFRTCANCGLKFHEVVGEYRYTFNPAKYEIGIGEYFHFENYTKRFSSHFCSKECLAEYVSNFAVDSVNEEGKKHIAIDKIRSDIDRAISEFH